jgi:hypothetical protein
LRVRAVPDRQGTLRALHVTAVVSSLLMALAPMVDRPNHANQARLRAQHASF